MMVTGEQLETVLPRSAASGSQERDDGAFGALVTNQSSQATHGDVAADRTGAGKDAPLKQPASTTSDGEQERTWRARDLLASAATMMGTSKAAASEPAVDGVPVESPVSEVEEIADQELPSLPDSTATPILELEAVAEPAPSVATTRVYTAVVPPTPDETSTEAFETGWLQGEKITDGEPALDVQGAREASAASPPKPLNSVSSYALVSQSAGASPTSDRSAASSQETGASVQQSQGEVHTLRPIEVARGSGAPAPAQLWLEAGAGSSSQDGVISPAQAKPSRFAGILSSVRTSVDDDPVVPINLGRASFDAATQAVLQTNVGRREQMPAAAGQLLYHADVAAILGHSPAAAGSIGAAPTASPSEALPEARVTTSADALVRDFGGIMARDFKAGHRWLDIRLDPAELGRIDVRMRVDHKGMVHAVIAADNASTYDLLRRESDTLVRSLQEAGIKADAGSLKFDLRSGLDQNGQQSARQHFSRRGWDDPSEQDSGRPEPATSTVRGYLI